MAAKSDAAMDAAARLMDGGWKACGTRNLHYRDRSVTERRENEMCDFMSSGLRSARVKVEDEKRAVAEQRGFFSAAKSLGYNTKEQRKVAVMAYKERGVWYVQLQRRDVAGD